MAEIQAVLITVSSSYSIEGDEQPIIKHLSMKCWHACVVHFLVFVICTTAYHFSA